MSIQICLEGNNPYFNDPHAREIFPRSQVIHEERLYTKQTYEVSYLAREKITPLRRVIQIILSLTLVIMSCLLALAFQSVRKILREGFEGLKYSHALKTAHVLVPYAGKIDYDPQVARLAAIEIMKSDWKNSNDERQRIEDARSLSPDGQTISQAQGPIHFREKVVNVMEKIHSCNGLSLQALRECKHHNEELFSLLQQKRLSHALSIEGMGTLPSGQKFSFSGFNETFTIPMLASSLFRFASETLEEQEKASALGTILQNALFHDRLSDERIKKGLADLEEGVPLFIGGGWDWHNIAVTLVKGENKDEYYALVSNRGKDSSNGKALPGWNVYKIKNVDEAMIKHFTSRQNHTRSDYLSCKMLEETFGATLIYQHRMKRQKAQNCTYISVKSGINALMAVWELTKGFKLALTDESFTKLELLKRSDNSYKAFSNADKRYVLSDFLIDLKECAGKLSPIGKLVYEKLTTTFPILGFNIGWFLWLEIKELCEFADPELKVDPTMSKLAKLFIEESKKEVSPFRQLVQLTFLIRDQDDLKKHLLAFVKLFDSSIEGFALSETEKIVHKLISDRDQICQEGGFVLLGNLIKKGYTFDSLEFCKAAILKIHPDNNPGFYKVIEAFIIQGHFDIVQKWMQDPEVKKCLNKLFDRAFVVLSYIYPFKEIKILLPFLSQEYRGEALKNLSNCCADDKLWNQSREIINEIKLINIQHYFNALLYLSNKLGKDQKFEEAKGIIDMLKEEGAVYQMEKGALNQNKWIFL